ncbi:hypothetical protein LguiB_032578 [Lonicera macranthoides]
MGDLGYDFDEKKFEEIFSRFKTIAEKKKLISDNDLVLLACDDGPKELTSKLVDMQVAISLPAEKVEKTDTGDQGLNGSSVGKNLSNAASQEKLLT